MADKKDLIVFDEEFYKAKEELISYGSDLSDLISSYITSVDTILLAAIKDQLIADALHSLVEHARPYKDLISGITQKMGNGSADFIREIDAADKFLY